MQGSDLQAVFKKHVSQAGQALRSMGQDFQAGRAISPQRQAEVGNLVRSEADRIAAE